MPTFKNIDDLSHSLRAAGLESHIDRVVSTARPVILFIRSSENDDPLPVGASKVGGLPDWPEGMPWPTRSAYPNDKGQHAKWIKNMGPYEPESTPAEDALAESALLDYLGTEEYERHVEKSLKYKSMIQRWRSGLLKLWQRPFPLAFFAQVNLGELAHLPGFPPDFPTSGVLSFFADITGGWSDAPPVYWHQCSLQWLERTSPPQDIIDWSDEWAANAHQQGEERKWSRLTNSEFLMPVSALSIPEHWRRAYPKGSALYGSFTRWFENMNRGKDEKHYFPRTTELTQTYGGDSLGGWPQLLKNDPEPDLIRPNAPSPDVIIPGQTEWRHLFSYGAEHWGTSRLMGTARGGDGNNYVMIRQNDLEARRFERAKTLYHNIVT